VTLTRDNSGFAGGIGARTILSAYNFNLLAIFLDLNFFPICAID
jgi:hypothetical protein